MEEEEYLMILRVSFSTNNAHTNFIPPPFRPPPSALLFLCFFLEFFFSGEKMSVLASQVAFEPAYTRNARHAFPLVLLSIGPTMALPELA